MSDRDTEAAHWFARMRTPGAEADRAEFDAWHSDPENAEAYANAKEDWLITGGVAEEHLAAHRQVPSKATPPYRAHWALAAALVLAISLAFAWVLLGNRGAEPIVADNATGEVVLEDGTRVNGGRAVPPSPDEPTSRPPHAARAAETATALLMMPAAASREIVEPSMSMRSATSASPPCSRGGPSGWQFQPKRSTCRNQASSATPV